MAIIKKLFHYGNLRLIDRTKVHHTLAFVTVAHLCEVAWNAHGLLNRLPYEYETGKLSRLSGSAPMARRFADGAEEKIADIKVVLAVYCEEFATSGVSSDFAKAVSLYYSDKKMVYIAVLSPQAQDALLNRRLNPAAPVVGKAQASSSTTTGANDPKDDDNECYLEGAVGSDYYERVAATHRLPDFQDSCAKRRKDPGTIAEASELLTDLVDQEARADAGPFIKLLSVKGPLATA